MKKVVTLEKPAEKFIRKLRDAKLRNQLLDVILKLENDPLPHGSKKLVNFSETYRLRVREYRILYHIFSDEIVVTNIDHWRDVYR